MKHTITPDPNGKGSYLTSASGDVEYVDPIKHFTNAATSIFFFHKKDIATSKFPDIPHESFDKPILDEVTKWAEAEMKRIISTPFPEKLLSLLDANSKKSQEKLLKGLSLTTDEFTSFICHAFTAANFSLSEYVGEHYPNGFEGKQLPILAHKKENGEIKSIGETSLKTGEIKNLIDQRSVIVSKFLDKGEKWHCFFLTYKSLNGEETGEKPHLHYISHYWGLTRKQVVEQLKSKSYRLPSLPHIDYHTHRNPK